MERVKGYVFGDCGRAVAHCGCGLIWEADSFLRLLYHFVSQRTTDPKYFLSPWASPTNTCNGSPIGMARWCFITNSAYNVCPSVVRENTQRMPVAFQRDSATTKGKHWVSQSTLNRANRPLIQWFNYSIGHSLWQTMLSISNHSMCFSIKRKAHPKPNNASHTLQNQWCHRIMFCLFCS